MPDKQINSYTKVLNLGHAGLEGFFDGGAIEITEKLDGSQFSFMFADGELHFRSKGAMVLPETAGMFEKGVKAVEAQIDRLIEGYIYRGEYLQKPKHNALAYSRTPDGHIALFGIDRGDQDWLTYQEMEVEASRLGLEAVPLIGYVHKPSMEWLEACLKTRSFLGGQTIEGIVLKNYRQYGRDGKTIMAKYVSEEFKEVHRKNWKAENPAHKDILEILGTELCTETRWRKAMEHLRDRGELTLTPRDIGPILREIQQDVAVEEREYVKDKLFKWAWDKHLRRAVTRGFAEWYKKHLAEQAFNGG